jgi:Rieske Fe-S protein
MSGEDQERFEDYLELERFIAELQAGRVAYPPGELTPAQARIYRMAMLFHAATPGVAEPDAGFAERLRERLEQELQTPPQETVPAVEVPEAEPLPPAQPQPQPVPLQNRRRLPRRWLLAGSVTAAASLVVGAGVDHVAEMAMQNALSQKTTVTKTGPEVTITLVSLLDWFPVTTVAELGNQAVKFRAEDQRGSLSLTGYVVRSDKTSNSAEHGYTKTSKGEIIAMSAACTHKGCIVAWSSSDRRFHCPCHGGTFQEDGDIDSGSSSLYLNPLPRLDVQVDNGQIYVRMPAS